MKALDNSKIKLAIGRYVESMFQHEVGFWKQHNSELLATLDAEREARYREHVAGLAMETVNDITSTGRIMERIRRGAFDPSNKITRRLFADLTGIALPRTVSGTRQALREYVGHEAFDNYYAEIEEARADKERREAEEAQREKEEEIARLKEAIASDKPVSGYELLDVARAVGINVHPRTAGTLRKRVVEIQSGYGRIRGGRVPDSVWVIYRQTKAAVTE